MNVFYEEDGAFKVAAKVLDRMSELKTLYGDPTKNSDDLANYDAEFTALKTQLDARQARHLARAQGVEGHLVGVGVGGDRGAVGGGQ